MGKKRHQEKTTAAGPVRVTPFAALKEMSFSRKGPDVVPPPPSPPVREEQPVEEDNDLFRRAMADVKVLSAGPGNERGRDIGDRPAPPPADDAELFRRAMGGVKSLGDPQQGPAKTKTARPVGRGSAQASSLPASADDQDSAELFLEAIGRLKLETKFTDSLPGDEELKPLSGNRLRQVKRGIISVTHQLDLHGLTREEALAALPRFLETARRKGQKAALVITGKGINSPVEPVLQQAVASWLRDAGRGVVLEFAPAPREMGGSGAYVVFLRPLQEAPVVS